MFILFEVRERNRTLSKAGPRAVAHACSLNRQRGTQQGPKAIIGELAVRRSILRRDCHQILSDITQKQTFQNHITCWGYIC